MSNMTFAEIHSLQFGLSESEIEECHLNNGVLQQSRTIYCFKEDEDKDLVLLSKKTMSSPLAYRRNLHFRPQALARWRGVWYRWCGFR